MHPRRDSAAREPHVATHFTARHFREALREIGVDYLFGNYLFGNPGTGRAPIVEAMARWRRFSRRTT